MSLSLATKELSRKELKGIMAGSGGTCVYREDCFSKQGRVICFNGDCRTYCC